jgi:hypothetical protein
MKYSVSCTAFLPLKKGSLCGLADIRFEEFGIGLRSVPVHESHGRRWAKMPSKPQVQDDRVVRDTAGKIKYAAVVDVDADARAELSSAIIKAVLERLEPIGAPDT